jgi:hypothetical protein
MSAASRAAEMESEANRPGKATCAGLGAISPPFHLRRFCRHQFIGVGAAFRRRPVFRTSTSRAFPRRLLARSAPAGSAASPAILAATSGQSGDLPASPSAPPLRCPVRSLVPFGSRLGPASAAPPPSRRIHANTELASDASLRGPVGGPPSSRSRRRGPGGSPATIQRQGRRPDRGEVERGETGEPLEPTLEDLISGTSRSGTSISPSPERIPLCWCPRRRPADHEFDPALSPTSEIELRDSLTSDCLPSGARRTQRFAVRRGANAGDIMRWTRRTS